VTEYVTTRSETTAISYNEINALPSDIKIVLFGAGPVAQKALERIYQRDLIVVDNNSSRWGTEWYQHTIQSPATLVEVLAPFFVLICTTSIDSVAQQVAGMRLVNLIGMAPSSHVANQLPIVKLEQLNPQVLFTSGEVRNQRGSTHPQGGLFLADFKMTSEARQLVPGSCHGVARVGTQFVVTSDLEGVVLLDANLEVINRRSLGSDAGPHGVGYIEQTEEIVVVSTTSDSLLFFDSSLRPTGTIQLSARQGVRAAHHINDVAVLEDNIFVSMFSYSGHGSNGVYDGVVLAINRHSGAPPRVVLSGLRLPHSPTFVDGNLYVADSLRGEIVGPYEERIASFGGFVRGLDFRDGYWLVGHSRNRNSGARIGEGLTTSIDTGFVLVDQIAGISTFSPLTAGVSEIHAVMFFA